MVHDARRIVEDLKTQQPGARPYIVTGFSTIAWEFELPDGLFSLKARPIPDSSTVVWLTDDVRETLGSYVVREVTDEEFCVMLELSQAIQHGAN